jgi:prepilin-type processing-associated H-X9-DG protein
MNTNLTPGKPTQRAAVGSKSDIGNIALFGAAVSVALWVTGCGGGGGGSNQYKVSVNRLHSLNISVLEYANDYDEGLPLAGKWMDGVLPYAKDETLYHSPAVAASGFGYALNSQVAGQDVPKFSSPATTISVFDSTDLARNATDDVSTEPSPPRYGNRNTIGYLDGHVQDYDTVNKVSLYSQSQSNLKQVDVGMLIYSNDYDSVAPLANEWMDELEPYLKNDALYHSPAVVLKNAANYGYAFNSAVAAQNLPNLTSPATTLSFFDSTVLSRNATALTSTLPNPPRYGKVNTLAYADGHVHP